MEKIKQGHQNKCDTTPDQDSGRKEKRDLKGRTNLYLRVAEDDVHGVTLLLQQGVNINAADFLMTTPLLLTIRQCNIKMAIKLIKAGADVNIANCSGRTPLIESAKLGIVELVNYLTEAKAEVNAADENGWTALHESASMGDEESTEILLDAGANVNATDCLGRTPLHLSARFGHKRTIKHLIKAGASVNAGGFQGRTALHESSMKGHADVVSLLLFHQASVDVQDVNLWTPLHEGSAGGHFEIVMSLLLSGATVVVENKDGDTPLMLATRRHHNSVELAMSNLEIRSDLKLDLPETLKTLMRKVISEKPTAETRFIEDDISSKNYKNTKSFMKDDHDSQKIPPYGCFSDDIIYKNVDPPKFFMDRDDVPSTETGYRNLDLGVFADEVFQTEETKVFEVEDDISSENYKNTKSSMSDDDDSQYYIPSYDWFSDDIVHGELGPPQFFMDRDDVPSTETEYRYLDLGVFADEVFQTATPERPILSRTASEESVTTCDEWLESIGPEIAAFADKLDNRLNQNGDNMVEKTSRNHDKRNRVSIKVKIVKNIKCDNLKIRQAQSLAVGGIQNVYHATNRDDNDDDGDSAKQNENCSDSSSSSSSSSSSYGSINDGNRDDVIKVTMSKNRAASREMNILERRHSI